MKRKLLIFLIAILGLSFVGCIETSSLETTTNTTTHPTINIDDATYWFMVTNNQDLVGFFDREGNMMIPFQFISALPFAEGTAIVKAEDTSDYGVIDVYGNYILQPIYRIIQYTENGYLYTYDEDHQARLMDLEGNVIDEITGITSYQYLGYEDYYGIKNTFGHYAVYSLSQGLLTEYKYQRLLEYSEGLLLVYDESYDVSYIDTEGNTVLEDSYTGGTSFQNGLASVRIEDLYHLINNSGQQMFSLTSKIPFNFNEDGVSLYREGDLYGTCDLSGNIITQANYEFKYHFYDDYGKQSAMYSVFVDMRNEDEVIFDNTGEVLYRTTDFGIVTREEDYLLLRSKTTDQMQVVDLEGNIILSSDIDTLSIETDPSGFMYIISKRTLYGALHSSIYDMEGNAIISNITGSSPTLNHQLGVVLCNDIYDLSGNLMTELPGVGTYLDGDLVIVHDNEEHFGIYDLSGNVVLPMQYRNIFSIELFQTVYLS